MLFIIAHPIANIEPSFPSRYSHDLADVLMSLTGEKIAVYRQEHVRLLKESIYNTYNLPHNNKLIIEAAITLLGHKAKKFSPTPDHDGMNKGIITHDDTKQFQHNPIGCTRVL